jgi:hypothetical protein
MAEVGEVKTPRHRPTETDVCPAEQAAASAAADKKRRWASTATAGRSGLGDRSGHNHCRSLREVQLGVQRMTEHQAFLQYCTCK